MKAYHFALVCILVYNEHHPVQFRLTAAYARKNFLVFMVLALTTIMAAFYFVFFLVSSDAGSGESSADGGSGTVPLGVAALLREDGSKKVSMTTPTRVHQSAASLFSPKSVCAKRAREGKTTETSLYPKEGDCQGDGMSDKDGRRQRENKKKARKKRQQRQRHRPKLKVTIMGHSFIAVYDANSGTCRPPIPQEFSLQSGFFKWKFL